MKRSYNKKLESNQNESSSREDHAGRAPGRPKEARGTLGGRSAVPGAGGAPLSKKQIEACVRETLEQYFKDLHGVEPHSMHEMFLSTVEKPLLDVVLRHADGNQSKAAEWLGINRNTLRRKLLEHKLVDQ